MDSNTVYVLGAGFSKGIGLPVSKDIVSSESFLYIQEKLKDNPLALEKIKNLQSYVEFRLENQYCDDNIESVLNHVATAKYLYMESTTEQQSYSADDIFSDLLWYVSRLIKEKTSDIETIPSEYQLFLKKAYSEQSTIITFNYDLIIEAVLGSLDYSFSYGIDENQTNDNQLILKLHGSLNWGLCDHCGPVDVFDKMLTFDNDSKISCPLCNGDIVSPLLVPPVIYKDSYYNDQHLVRDSWSIANEKLAQAQKIVFIGFSMAEDAYAKELFKLSLNMNSNDNLECVVVNTASPDKLKSKYKSVLVKEYFEIIPTSFTEYVKNDFN